MCSVECRSYAKCEGLICELDVFSYNNTYETVKPFYVFSTIQVFEIVYESRGKLIGGSLSRERKVSSRPSENKGGDSYLLHGCYIRSRFIS